MKKTLIFLLIILIVSVSLYAQEEKKMSAGLGLEWNMASRHDFAGGTVVNFMFNLPGATALGVSAVGSMNFNKIYVIEPGVLIRHYFNQGLHSGLFVQFNIGAFIAFEKDQDLLTMIMSGLGAGYRFNLGKLFYVEPFGRLGYPFAFGLGAMAGIRF